MQRITAALCTFLLALSLFSCKKDGGDGPTPPTNVTGEVTPVGTPDGSPISQKTIGAEGGTLSSTDGRLKVNIPAGALTANQQIKIQSISNHNPMGISKAYRLEPHSVEFSKPVTIEFAYTDDDISNTIPEALGIAYQDAKGIWKRRPSPVVDKAAKTIKVTTTHFSDWSLFESITLSSSKKAVHVSGTVDLEVYATEDLLAPLVPVDESAIGKKVSVTAAYIKEWKLAGAGNLQGNGPEAVYTAPTTVPSTNPVAVSVKLDLGDGKAYWLVTPIQILNDGEIEIRLAGGAWVKKLTSPAVKTPDDYILIGDSDGDEQGSYVFITWKGGVGTYGYKSPATQKGTHIHWHITGGHNYSPFYINANDELVASGGGLTITSMGEDDGYIKGTFTIQPAGYGDDLKSTINIEGKFKVRKSW
jgi:hypothetical protein